MDLMHCWVRGSSGLVYSSWYPQCWRQVLYSSPTSPVKLAGSCLLLPVRSHDFTTASDWSSPDLALTSDWLLFDFILASDFTLVSDRSLGL